MWKIVVGFSKWFRFLTAAMVSTDYNNDTNTGFSVNGSSQSILSPIGHKSATY